MAQSKGNCHKPENLKGDPRQCSPEQTRQCHGDAAGHPCVDTSGCKHPERLGGRKPGDCSPEQIRECHGDVAGHPCESA